VPFKDEKIESDMLKDVSHADVAKTDDTIDDTDPNYDDYYDVSLTSSSNSFVFNCEFSCFRTIKMSSQRRKKMKSQQKAN
jgi:hypothetical protein